MLTDYKNEGKWLTGRAALQLSHGGAGANTRAAKSFLTIGNPQGSRRDNERLQETYSIGRTNKGRNTVFYIPDSR